MWKLNQGVQGSATQVTLVPPAPCLVVVTCDQLGRRAELRFQQGAGEAQRGLLRPGWLQGKYLFTCCAPVLCPHGPFPCARALGLQLAGWYWYVNASSWC